MAATAVATNNGGVAGLSVDQLAEAIRLPLELLRSHDVTTIYIDSSPVVRFNYRDKSGIERGSRRLAALGARPTWDPKTKRPPVLYGLNWLDSQAAGDIVLCPTELDVLTLRQFGIAALAGDWKDDRDAELLDGYGRVYLVAPAFEDPGLAEWLPRSAIADRAQILVFPGRDPVSSFYLSDPATFEERLAGALRTAVAWAKVQQHELDAELQEVEFKCHELSMQPDILALFEAKNGERVAGSKANARLLYLALTTRVLPAGRKTRPISICYKGPSSVGKSYESEAVLDFFPSSSYEKYGSISPKGLLYLESSLKNRILVVAEAAGARDEEFAYLIRELLSSHKYVHLSTDVDASGPRKGVKLTVEGPVCFLVTTTELNLDPEVETRMLSLQADDSPEQTRAVLEKNAQTEDDDEDDESLEEWRALQRFLELTPSNVTVPYREAIAKNTRIAGTRLRRDFNVLLNLVRGHALLHQRTRERDERGWVVATLADYTAVHSLLDPLVAQGLEAAISKEIRETVGTVETLAGGAETRGASVTEVAKALKVDVSTASRRLKGAAKLRLVKNLHASKRGVKAAWVLDECMPGDEGIFPSPEVLAECCGLASILEGDSPLSAQSEVG